MININERIKVISDSDVSWNWDDSHPTFYTKTSSSTWGTHVKFDPFPCYSHDSKLVKEMASVVEECFPIGFDVYYFLFPYETIGRTNGQASVNTIEYPDKEKEVKGTWDGVIELYGKRIPIHPAMTRYLVAHEYGHIIDSWICNRRSLEYNGLDEDYAKLRGIDNNQKYGGRKWHTNVGEIIANDIRICLFNVEPEFWPHECEHPLKNQKVIDFWGEMKDKYSYKGE